MTGGIDSLLVFGTHATLARLLSTIETRADVDLVIEAVDKRTSFGDMDLDMDICVGEAAATVRAAATIRY
jgi:hypothetical protein